MCSCYNCSPTKDKKDEHRNNTYEPHAWVSEATAALRDELIAKDDWLEGYR